MLPANTSASAPMTGAEAASSATGAMAGAANPEHIGHRHAQSQRPDPTR